MCLKILHIHFIPSHGLKIDIKDLIFSEDFTWEGKEIPILAPKEVMLLEQMIT